MLLKMKVLVTKVTTHAVATTVLSATFDGYSRKQPTVETSTYGSEFVAAKLAVQQIINIQLMLRYLGVPVFGKTFLFGDNESVVKNGSIPHSRLKKRHNALSYHFHLRSVLLSLVIMESTI